MLISVVGMWQFEVVKLFGVIDFGVEVLFYGYIDFMVVDDLIGFGCFGELGINVVIYMLFDWILVWVQGMVKLLIVEEFGVVDWQRVVLLDDCWILVWGVCGVWLKVLDYEWCLFLDGFWVLCFDGCFEYVFVG